MRLVTIKSEKLKAYKVDPEMLQKSKRPCVLIIQLKYKGKRYDFAVPLRSNISPSAPKGQYFPLPPRSTTKDRHHHGLHYIKMFPVKRSYTEYFLTKNNVGATLIKTILDKNEKQIVAECQRYLTAYEQGERPAYSTDIDLLLDVTGLKK